MKKTKNKFEIILGVVTVIISLSAFKDELTQIDLNLGFKTITLAEYFLYCIYGFSISLYLYILEIVVRDTKIGKWKIFDYILKFAFSLFALIIFSPILMLVYVILYKLNLLLEENETFTIILLKVLQIAILILTIIYSIITAKRYRAERKNKLQEQAEEEEIKGLDNVKKLINDGYYSHSILESFKVLETHLYKNIVEKDIRVSKFRFNDIIKIALKEKIINEEDLKNIDILRKMRNVSAHTDQNHTKHQAEIALKFIRNLLKR
jgi:hypothetical protein